MQIKKITHFSLPGFEQLKAESQAQGFNFLNRLEQEWLQGINQFSLVGEGLYGVYQEEKLIAVGGINVNPYTKIQVASIGRLRRFYVLKQWRRQKVGQQLLAHILNKHQAYFTEINLYTNNPKAANFYLQCGFEKVNNQHKVSHRKLTHSFPVTYRNLLATDTPFLQTMLYQALYVPEGNPPFPTSILDEPSIAKYIANWGSLPNDLAIVAIGNQQPIGAIWGRQFPANNKGYGFVNAQTPEISMAILPAYRNKGIGTKLLTQLEKAYQQTSIKTLSLSVDKRNPAKRLYQRNAYLLYKEEGTALTLWKTISKEQHK